MFEQEAIQYVNNLVTNGTLLTGDLIGVSELQQIAKVKATFLISGIAKDKLIMVKKINETFSWYFLSPTDANELNQVEDDWSYPEFAKRIIAPIQLIMDDIGIKMYGWFNINSLPVKPVGVSVHLYCNVILPEHQTIIDGLGGMITVEDRPTS